MELRWLKLDEYQIEEHANSPLLKSGENTYVLKYREREGPEGEDWWGNWKDVDSF